MKEETIPQLAKYYYMGQPHGVLHCNIPLMERAITRQNFNIPIQAISNLELETPAIASSQDP
jgi:hypothetical protein